MKKIIVLVLVLILGFAIFVFFFKKDKNVIETKATEVKRGEIKSFISASGKVISENTVKISSKMGGKIIFLSKKEGDFVKKGELIAMIDDSELRMQLKQQEANMELAKAKYNQIKKGAREQEIEVIRQTYLSAEYNLEEADKNLKRIEELYRENFATLQQLENAKLQRQIAESQLTQAKEQLKLVKTKTTEDDIKISEAQIKQQEAGMELINTQINNTLIYSPISGKVMQKFINEGEIIPPSAPILSVANMKTLVIEVNIDESEVEKIKEGNKVKITLDAYPDKHFEGEVYYISDESFDVIKEVGITFPCRVRLFNNALFRIGMTANVEILTEVKKNILYISSDGILEENAKNFVYVIIENKAIKRKVKIGVSNEDLTEIKDGLSGGEIIALTNLEKLKEGSKVKYAYRNK